MQDVADRVATGNDAVMATADPIGSPVASMASDQPMLMGDESWVLVLCVTLFNIKVIPLAGYE